MQEIPSNRKTKRVANRERDRLVRRASGGTCDSCGDEVEHSRLRNYRGFILCDACAPEEEQDHGNY